MKPDDRKCTYAFLEKPKEEVAPSIAFTPKTLKWIKAMVECHNEEIGFFGLVEEIGDLYIITEIFYPKHCLANAGTCEISIEGETEISQKLIDENRIDDISKVRFWGHSHHNMGTTPSGQDDSQAIEKMKNNGAYFIRAICNKKDELSVSFFDYARQMKFENIKWTIMYNYDEMLFNVTSLINAVMPAKDKVHAIMRAVNPKINFADAEYKEIEAEVKRLKEIQLPKTSVVSTNHTRYGYGFNDDFYRQQDMFDPHFDGRFGPYMPGINDEKKTPLVTDAEINAIADGCW